MYRGTVSYVSWGSRSINLPRPNPAPLPRLLHLFSLFLSPGPAPSPRTITAARRHASNKQRRAVSRPAPPCLPRPSPPPGPPGRCAATEDPGGERERPCARHQTFCRHVRAMCVSSCCVDRGPTRRVSSSSRPALPPSTAASCHRLPPIPRLYARTLRVAAAPSPQRWEPWAAPSGALDHQRRRGVYMPASARP